MAPSSHTLEPPAIPGRFMEHLDRTRGESHIELLPDQLIRDRVVVLGHLDVIAVEHAGASQSCRSPSADDLSCRPDEFWVVDSVSLSLEPIEELLTDEQNIGLFASFRFVQRFCDDVHGRIRVVLNLCQSEV